MIYAKARQEDLSANENAQCVGWAKRPGANASGGVPTESARRRSIQKMVGTAQMRLCPPYGLSAKIDQRMHKLERRRVKVMAKFAKELITSLTQAAKHARGGKVKGMRVTAVELPDVKAIRRSLRMSQNRFSVAYRIPLATLKNWEQGRRHPDAPAAAFCSPSSESQKKSGKPWRTEVRRFAMQTVAHECGGSHGRDQSQA
jgi:putative transcriptional regulator